MNTFSRLLALTLLATFMVAIGAQDFYIDREKQAPVKVSQNLKVLRQQIAQKQFQFTVGYTTAMDFSLEQLTGLKVDENYLKEAGEQNKLSEQLNQTDDQEYKRNEKRIKKDPALEGVSVDSCYALKKFDWRTYNKVSKVRNQGGCGSCWAFATLGAFESSFSIRNGFTINASEQCVLNCSGAGSCAGGWWAYNFLITKGVAAESAYPYTATDVACNNAIPRPYKAVSWGYVSAANNIPTVAQIKTALLVHGPLAVAVRATPAFQAYVGGVFNEHAAGNVNHGVTLIGWDDYKGAWIIKNSWGTGWGDFCGGTERGFMYIAYNSNSIGYAASWVRAKSVWYILPVKYYEYLKPFRLVPENFKEEQQKAEIQEIKNLRKVKAVDRAIDKEKFKHVEPIEKGNE